MSHNLTQPEEIDLVWMAMANHDMEMDMPIPDWAQLSGTIRDAERHELVRRKFSDTMVSLRSLVKTFQDTGSSLVWRR